MKLSTTCDQCGIPIFDGESYYWDDYFEIIACSKDCLRDNYDEQSDRLFENHVDSNCYEQDSV